MKKYLSFVMCCIICICIGSTSVVAVDTRDISVEERYATTLKELELFKGVSDTDFDLDRAPTRIEALVMLIRVLGKEQDALNGTWRHPFDDVPSWANPYVGYAYVNGLTNGVSINKFGDGNASSDVYLTFVLRALGYSDENGVDFSWDNPDELAKAVGILPDNVDVEKFWRADVATVSYFALSAKLNGSDDTLADKLINAGVFSREQYNSAMGKPIADVPQINDAETQKELTPAQIFEKCSPAIFSITTYDVSGNPLAMEVDSL